jgi:hypothetical protein
VPSFQVSGVGKSWPISVHELSAAMYFLLAQRRGERGARPDQEQDDHRMCGPISDDLLQQLLALAPLPLHFMPQCATPVEIQLKAAQQGWKLVFCHHQAGPRHPAFALLCHPERKVVSVVVRGAADMKDMMREIRTMPSPFPQTTKGERGGWTKVRPAPAQPCPQGLQYKADAMMTHPAS